MWKSNRKTNLLVHTALTHTPPHEQIPRRNSVRSLTVEKSGDEMGPIYCIPDGGFIGILPEEERKDEIKSR